MRGALQREAKRNQTNIIETQIPKLWILTPTASKNLLSGFNGTPKPDSLPGIYYLPQSLRIDELAALPSNQPYVKITLELLYNLQQNLRINQSSQTEDRELAKQEGEQRLIIRQLNRRIGEIESSLIQRVQALSIEKLEELGEALLDFTSIGDLENWLQSVN